MIQKTLHNSLKRKGRIVIDGFYGAGNLGDEVILSATLNQISSLQGVQPVIFSKDPVETNRMHRVVSFDPYAKHSITGYLNLLRSTVYILGGGGLIKDYGESSRSIEKILCYLAIAKSFGLKTMLWSVGMENLRFNKSKELVQGILSTVDAITVRDPNSKKRLEELGIQNNITVTADPSILLVARYSKQRSLKKNPRVVACLRHWFKYGFYMPDYAVNEQMLNSVASVLDFMINNLNAEIEFLPFRTISYDDDREITKMVVSRMTEIEHIIVHSRAPQIDEAINILLNADLLVGMRLHSVILATSLGIPSIALSYMPKVRDYMAYINQENFCFDIEDIDKNCLQEAVEKIMNGYEEISEHLIISSSDLSRRLQDNMRILSNLLNREYDAK